MSQYGFRDRKIRCKQIGCKRVWKWMSVAFAAFTALSALSETDTVRAETRMEAMKRVAYDSASYAGTLSKTEWRKIEEMTVALDKKNRVWKVVRQGYLREGDSDIPEEVEKYHYKKDLLDSIKYYENGKKIATEKYEYDESGKLCRLSLVDNRGEEFGYINYSYDTEGRLAKQKGRMLWVQDDRQLRIWDDRSSWVRDDSGCVMPLDLRKRIITKPYSCTYRYDAKGRLKKKWQDYYYLQSKKAKQLSHERLTTKYTWRADGSIQRIREDNISKGWKKSYFDENGRMTHSESFRLGFETNFHDDDRYEYELDSNGDIRQMFRLHRHYHDDTNADEYADPGKIEFYYSEKTEYSEYQRVKLP